MYDTYYNKSGLRENLMLGIIEMVTIHIISVSGNRVTIFGWNAQEVLE